MIAKLNGRIDSLGEDWAIVDVNGVGYLVFCSGRTLGQLQVGEAASLLIETHVREDHIHLYGFLHVEERDWYKLLTTVQGVGAKVALAIMGVLSIDELTQAVAAQDKTAISRAPGVGPKLAGRIASELKDKVAKMALGAPSPTAAPASAALPAEDSALRDATSALVNLGYGPSEALAAVSHAAGKIDGEPVVADLIRLGLAELGSHQ